MKKILLVIFSTFFIFALLKSLPVTANENKKFCLKQDGSFSFTNICNTNEFEIESQFIENYKIKPDYPIRFRFSGYLDSFYGDINRYFRVQEVGNPSTNNRAEFCSQAEYMKPSARLSFLKKQFCYANVEENKEIAVSSVEENKETAISVVSVLNHDVSCNDFELITNSKRESIEGEINFSLNFNNFKYQLNYLTSSNSIYVSEGGDIIFNEEKLSEKQKNSFKFDEANKNFVFNFKINQNDFNLFYDPKKQELLMQSINGSIEVASKCEQQPYLTATISKYYGKIINKKQNDTQAQKEIAKEKATKPTNEVAKVEKVKETKNQNLNTESLVIKASSPVKTKINHERAGYDVVCDNDFTFSQGGEVQFVDGNARLTFDLLKKKYLVEVFAEELVFKIRFNNSVYDVDNNFIGTIDDNSIFVDQNKIYFEAGEGNKGAFKFEYSILNNIFTTKFYSPEGSFDFKAICKTSPEFVKVFNQVYNPIISNQLNDSKTSAVSISKEDLKEKLQFYKDLYEEELITKEEYENVRKEILSGSINNTTASNQDAQINQVQGQLDLERQKLEEMKRQTQLAQQDLLEQKRIANEAAKSNKRNKFNDNMKSAKKGLCLMQGGSFSSC